MADTREFAKIDVGWHLNAKWYTVERILRRLMPDALPDALLLAHADARCMHMVSILHASQQRSDGLFPVAAVKVLARATSEEAITALFEVGMWINRPGGMAEVRDFLEHQPSADDRDRATRKAKKAAEVRWSKDASSIAPSTAPRNAQESRGEERREEVESDEKNTRRATQLPSTWKPTPDHVARATESGLDLDREVVKFRAHAEEKGRTAKNWNSAFTRWLINAAEYASRDTRPRTPAPKPEISPWDRQWKRGPDD
ncbi:MAG: hypothetical protein J0H73_11785 [Salana multivorans]|uniref:hypothetical protein n=1 Tax=Salana multivorans TaxID=120377 RepID=UPI000963368A|nr:hypothetical protein [Salana multivorans]MBN8882980.1 hypothetical protein [Salana multivorans]OJX94066.1 MAG: hypothetical protein BGO96_09675 [Micrococcales bacterium 73-15]